ncbi:DUF1127 domain-containing protein [Thioclava atlantica]|uniref:YjiS-like domain-containing protein n=1 Tax=Thioclava atlantica TaxID=1317124 RepID=A0A085TX55_9RHOB|nr:DUF1127 domain-containing protein [Thioclava atlantica]KFE35302.1 hypothetical protein DW2_07732 [Thioclava atlantica]
MFTLSRTRPATARLAAPGLIARVARVLATRRSRAALAKLDPRLLDDIGISEAMARSEMRRFL